MQEIFLVPGYGVPKNILKDLNYAMYLRAVANAIFDRSQITGIRPMVILSGGPTDCWKPYRRTEAQEMLRWLKSAVSSKDFRRQFKGWKIKLETRSLSTLENAVFTKQLVKSTANRNRVTIFTEATRHNRWIKLVQAVGIRRATVVPIDFDASPNRYRTDEVRRKERAMVAFDRWAIQKSANYRQHHRFFQQRIAYLRSAGPNNQVEAVRKFWTEGIKFLPPVLASRLRKYLS